MGSTQRQVAHKWIVFGYCALFVGTSIGVIWQVTNQYFVQSWRVDVNSFSAVSASFAALIAWWFLSRINADKPDQISLVRKAFLGLALQSLLVSTNAVIYLVNDPNLSWQSASTWGYALGTTSTMIGFFLMAMSYPSVSNATDQVVPAEK